MSRPRITVVGSINLDLVARCSRLPQPGETVGEAANLLVHLPEERLVHRDPAFALFVQASSFPQAQPPRGNAGYTSGLGSPRG